jgi:hypothetical protein
MTWKDWLVGALFVLMLAFAVTAVVIVLNYEHHPHKPISQSQEERLQKLCYGNTGNGGC